MPHPRKYLPSAHQANARFIAAAILALLVLVAFVLALHA